MTAAYIRWVNDGRPWKFGRAAKAFADHLHAHGYTVYMQGNEDHLRHDPPEDHTPYSESGWPGMAPYPYCLAVDVMPPTPGQKSLVTGQPLPSLQKLAAQLRADKIAGHPGAAFVKYLNWEPDRDNGGPCYHDSWTPTYARRSSSDRGHIHVSSRTDYATSAASDDYDLVARVMGDDDVTADEIRDAARQGLVDVLSCANRAAVGQTTKRDAAGRVVQLTEQEKTYDRQVLAMLRSAVGGPTEDDIAASTATLLAAVNGDTVNAAQIAAQVLAGLDPQKIAAAIPSNLAQQVVHELVARLDN